MKLQGDDRLPQRRKGECYVFLFHSGAGNMMGTLEALRFCLGRGGNAGHLPHRIVKHTELQTPYTC